MYDSEIYRHQIAEYYNPYVLDADIQAGEFYSTVSIYRFIFTFFFFYLNKYIEHIWRWCWEVIRLLSLHLTRHMFELNTNSTLNL